MTVPALDTSKIGTFAYIQPATSIQLADALPYFKAYRQYPEYVDGVMRIWDSGSESPLPNNYCDVYVRIRTDGWMMAFFPRNIADPPASHAYWTLLNYNNRGDLIWWGHTSSVNGNPTTNATRLGRALAELWTAVKANSNNPTYVFSYADVGYYDYEHTTSTKIYVFGSSRVITSIGCVDNYYYFTIPIGTTIQCIFSNYGYMIEQYTPYVPSYFKLNEGTGKEHIIFLISANWNSVTNGFLTSNEAAYIYNGGIQNSVHVRSCWRGATPYTYMNTGFVIFASA